MLNPGGSPGTTFNKSATTRFNNSQITAARGQMVGNRMAQQALRNQYSKKNPGAPVGGNQSSQAVLPQQPVGNVQLPTGGPQMSEQAAQDFDPSVFADELINNLVGEIRTEQFLESPRVKDAMTSIRLKNIMNSDNPRYRKDPRPLFQQVVSKIGMD